MNGIFQRSLIEKTANLFVKSRIISIFALHFNNYVVLRI